MRAFSKQCNVSIFLKMIIQNLKILTESIDGVKGLLPGSSGGWGSINRSPVRLLGNLAENSWSSYLPECPLLWRVKGLCPY